MSEPVKFTLDEFVASLGDPHHPAVIEYMALREHISALEQKVNMLESLEVKYIEEIQELHDRIIALRAI